MASMWLLRLSFILLFTSHLHPTNESLQTRFNPDQPRSLTHELLESARDPEFVEWLKRTRRRVHEDPELAFEEYNTSKFIRAELESLDIEYKWPFAKTGLVGSVGEGGQPWFGLRADMDALPIQGTVKLVFQPGEESYGGAYHMLKEGAVDDLRGIFALHVTPDMPVGVIGSRPGPVLAGSGRFMATIKGKGGHAATPQNAIDPVLAASFTILALQQLVSRETDPLQANVVSVGLIEAGNAGNVIPETVRFGGTFRIMTTEGLTYLQQRIREIVENEAVVHRCGASLDFMEDKMRPYPATINDEALYNHAKKVGEELLGEANVLLLPPSMGAEDFSFYAQKMAAAFFSIGAGNEKGESAQPLHSPYLVLNEEVLPLGAALHAAVAISYLNNQAIQAQ